VLDIRPPNELPELTEGPPAELAIRILMEWHVVRVAVIQVGVGGYIFMALEVDGHWFDLHQRELQIQVLCTPNTSALTEPRDSPSHSSNALMAPWALRSRSWSAHAPAVRRKPQLSTWDWSASISSATSPSIRSSKSFACYHCRATLGLRRVVIPWRSGVCKKPKTQTTNQQKGKTKHATRIHPGIDWRPAG